MKYTPPHRRWIPLVAILLLTFTAAAHAAEVIPPKPAEYFNDYTGTVGASAATQINEQLKQFERDTSNQLVVAVFPKMQSDSDMAEYCTRVFRAWKVGQKDKNNGVVLFVFKNDRKMQIITGYGLEGALPDVTCEQIIDNEIRPQFKNDHYAEGLQAGVTAIIAATKGEYKGTGAIVGDKSTNWLWVVIVIIFVLLWVFRLTNGFGGLVFSSMGSSYGGGWSSGGDSFGGGGGGFSGGGGSSGGGGAGGSW